MGVTLVIHNLLSISEQNTRDRYTVCVFFVHLDYWGLKIPDKICISTSHQGFNINFLYIYVYYLVGVIYNLCLFLSVIHVYILKRLYL